jgi:hypothetical protein
MTTNGHNENGAAYLPQQGQMVEVRNRRWLVVDVSAPAASLTAPLNPTQRLDNLVTLSSVEDDGLGEEIQVIWELEQGARVFEKAELPEPVGFDLPSHLDIFLDAVRWGASSATDNSVFQAPFRSGLQIEDYQLDPLVRAIKMPRVN